jgi:hypothetical protein
MNELEHMQKEQGGPHSGGNKPAGPYWKRMHHSPFFWLSLICIFLAMGIFVMTDYFMVRPRVHPQVPVAGSP